MTAVEGGSGVVARIDVPGRLVGEVSVEAGSVTAVLGPNGAGKTTLLHAIAGLLADPGEIVVDGEVWDAPGAPGRLVRERGVGVVFQDQSLFPHLSAEDNVAFGPIAAGGDRTTARASALEWLDRFGIGDLASRKPNRLSGGQAQRVAIARALASDPRILLMDEPFAGLDVGVAADLRTELRRHLAAYSGAVLLVTHDVLDALVLADRLVVLDAGEVVQTGTPGEVTARPQTPHVARLAGLNLIKREGLHMAFRPSDVAVSPAAPVGSPRYRWHGRIESLVPSGDAQRASVATDDGDVAADLTPSAIAELGLGPGSEVWLSVKATAVQTYSAS